MSATRYWLLDLGLDGETRRYSTTEVDADGSTYRSGLADDLAVQRGADSVDVTIVDPTTDWPSVALDLDGGDAQLRRTTDGDPVAYCTGECRVISYGARDEPVQLRIERRSGADSLGTQVPDVLAVVSTETFPLAGALSAGEDLDAGRPYPVILGCPGYRGESEDPYCVVPVLLAQYAFGTSLPSVVVAEDGAQAITLVRIRNGQVGLEADETVVRTSDLLGRPIRMADFLTDPTVQATPGDPHDLSAGYTIAGGGGPRTAYDVVEYLLRKWGGSSVDWSRLPEVRDSLGLYLVDTWIDAPPPDPWSWLESTLLASLPFTVRTGPNGRYLVEYRYVSDPDRNVGTLVVGRGCARVGAVQVSTGPANEFTARYRPDRDGGYLAAAVLTGRDGVQSARTSGAVVTTTVRSGRCTASAARYGPRQGDTIDLDWCWDEGTALLVLATLAERDALPARLVQYQVDDGEDLDEGDELTLTDTDRGIVGLPAIVDAPPLVSSVATTVSLRVPS